MRQQGEKNRIFRDLLTRVSNGCLTKEDWETHLCPREFKKLSAEEQKWFQDNGTKLCTKNAELFQHNIMKIKQLETPIAQVKAINRGPNAKNQKSSSTSGLQNTILLAKGAKVMCVFNLAKKLGIVNGMRFIFAFFLNSY